MNVYNNEKMEEECGVFAMYSPVLRSDLAPLTYYGLYALQHRGQVSHGEGRVVISQEMYRDLLANGQIVTKYVDLNGNETMKIDYNPNGSEYAIEGLTSLDGKILGKMGHSERAGEGLYKNISGNTNQNIFKNGVKYFK
jgi:phosphoribosylformylglycinamidine synthase